MKKYIKIYFDYFDIDYDPVSGWHDCKSEISGLPSTDLHHIVRRGIGGSQGKDTIENLMALTREEHEKYGDKSQYIEWLQEIHDNHIKKFTKS